MLVFSTAESSRLTYVLGLLGRELFGAPLALTTDEVVFTAHSGPKLQYGGIRSPATTFYIPSAPLLFETGVRSQTLQVFLTADLPVFFAGEGDLPFDLPAAIFFLLSRYEEWLPFTPDKYGRFPPEGSLAHRNGFLQRPLIDEWIGFFKTKLLAVFPGIVFRKRSFTFLPTYDIDMAWSYRRKGFLRNTAGFVKDIINGDWSGVRERRTVLSGDAPDPFDCFDWMDALHKKHSLHPRYFLLLTARPGRFDKNISPADSHMQDLVRRLAGRYDTGIHPSWQSGTDSTLLAGEIATLRQLSGAPVLSSRQHYLRLDMPVTYRRLVQAGIRQDFSMGYGAVNGFRASFTGDFYWYDLDKEQETGLLLTPFCFMDFAACDQSGNTAGAMLNEMRMLAKAIARVDGRMVTLWHNHFLGPAERRNWRDAYGQFVLELDTPEAVEKTS